MKKCLLILLSAGIFAMILSGCSGMLPSDNSQEGTVSVAEPETAGSELPETTKSPSAEDKNADTGETDNASSYYGTWEIKDYQGAGASALSSDDMESFRGKTITYQPDSILLDGEKVADGSFAYKTEDDAYNYDSLTEAYRANLGEWWNNISEVTCVMIDSNESFFGNHFFVADLDTIWIYYEGVFFLAKQVKQVNFGL